LRKSFSRLIPALKELNKIWFIAENQNLSEQVHRIYLFKFLSSIVCIAIIFAYCTMPSKELSEQLLNLKFR
jgi:hypothetical protein